MPWGLRQRLGGAARPPRQATPSQAGAAKRVAGGGGTGPGARRLGRADLSRDLTPSRYPASLGLCGFRRKPPHQLVRKTGKQLASGHWASPRQSADQNPGLLGPGRDSLSALQLPASSRPGATISTHACSTEPGVPGRGPQLPSRGVGSGRRPRLPARAHRVPAQPLRPERPPSRPPGTLGTGESRGRRREGQSARSPGSWPGGFWLISGRGCLRLSPNPSCPEGHRGAAESQPQKLGAVAADHVLGPRQRHVAFAAAAGPAAAADGPLQRAPAAVRRRLPEPLLRGRQASPCAAGDRQGGQKEGSQARSAGRDPRLQGCIWVACIPIPAGRAAVYLGLSFPICKVLGGLPCTGRRPALLSATGESLRPGRPGAIVAPWARSRPRHPKVMV